MPVTSTDSKYGLSIRSIRYRDTPCEGHRQGKAGEGTQREGQAGEERGPLD